MQRDVVAGVIQLSNLLMRRLGPVFEKARVTPQQWAILSTLGESEEPLTLAGVARVMLVSKQNMTGMIARLEQLGLAERHDDPSDLRSSRLALTRRGKATVDKAETVRNLNIQYAPGSAFQRVQVNDPVGLETGSGVLRHRFVFTQ